MLKERPEYYNEYQERITAYKFSKLKDKPNVLGSKEKNLDLLEDQRDQIEKIIRKKKKKLGETMYNEKSRASLGATNKDIKFGTSSYNTPSHGRNSLGAKDLKKHFPDKSPFVEYDKNINKQKGGGLFSPSSNFKKNGDLSHKVLQGDQSSKK